MKKSFLILIAIVVGVCCSVSVTGQSTIYLHNFGTTAISAHPYTVAPGTFESNLSSSSWSNSTNSWTSYAGSSGQAISLANSSGTPTITLTFNVATGYELEITQFNFWRQRSSTGAQNWSMTINGTSVGSGTVPTTGAAIGNTNVSNTISGLSGTITVVISLSGASGTGTFRLDDFVLIGNVTSTSPTLTLSTLTSFGNVCTGNTAGPNSFTITGTNLTTANVTVAALSGYTYSTTAGGTYTSSLSLSQSGGSYSQEIFVRFSPIAVQSYNGNIAVGGGGATSKNCAANGSGINSTPTITSPSSASITINSASLGGNITATGCTNVTKRGIFWSTTSGFADGAGTEVSVSSGPYTTGAFSVSLTGLSHSTTYYYKAFAENSAGRVYTAQGSFTTATPTITLTPTTLTAFTYVEGSGPSSEKTFTVSGSNLAGNISISAPTNYEISKTSGSGYTSPLTFTQSGGTVSSTTVYVRLKSGLSVGNYNGENITASSTSATNKTVACSGSVSCPSVSAPTATAATSVAGTSFTANWNSVSGASGYELDVYQSGSAIIETFTSIEGGTSSSYLDRLGQEPVV
jgi:hypothetical protein